MSHVNVSTLRTVEGKSELFVACAWWLLIHWCPAIAKGTAITKLLFPLVKLKSLQGHRAQPALCGLFTSSVKSANLPFLIRFQFCFFFHLTTCCFSFCISCMTCCFSLASGRDRDKGLDIWTDCSHSLKRSSCLRTFKPPSVTGKEKVFR